MADFKTIDDFDLADKRVLVRVDFNVPLKDGKVTDATRIERTAPTLLEMSERGARVVLLSHLGRPDGKADPKLSLRPVAAALGAALDGRQVPFAEDCVGAPADKVVKAMKRGDIVLLENVRFHAAEEKNDRAFAARLAAVGDVYVNDAFSCAHRAHASTEAIAHLLPAAAGRLMEAELKALTDALERPAHPVAALVGGAKISTKLEVLGHLSRRVDQLIIGGAMANTFLNAQGIKVGKSLMEADMAEAARRVLSEAKQAGCEVVLPSDAIVAKALKEESPSQAVAIDAVPEDAMILDIGPASTAALVKRVGGLRTLLWNGPLGAFEVLPFDAATNTVAREAARLTQAGRLLSVAGGGDTVAALAHAGVIDEFSYVSTAGGAFLEWLEGRKLPGVEALRRTA